MKKIFFIIPCRNEEEGIAEVLARIPRGAKSIVVDNASTDSTAKTAREKGAIVLFEKEQGKGNAFRKAKQFLGKKDYEYCVMIDGDNTYSPEEAEKLLRAMEKNKCDVVVGNRITSSLKPLEMGFLSRLGNICLTLFAKILFLNFSIDDLCSGYWCLSKEALEKICVKAKGFDLEADLFSECCAKELKLCSIPITYGKRLGKKKLRLGDGAGIILKLITKRIWGV